MPTSPGALVPLALGTVAPLSDYRVSGLVTQIQTGLVAHVMLGPKVHHLLPMRGAHSRAQRHLPCPPRKQVLGTKVDAERDGVKVPTTLAEYCVKSKAPVPEEGPELFYEDDCEDGSCLGDEDSSESEGS